MKRLNKNFRSIFAIIAMLVTTLACGLGSAPAAEPVVETAPPAAPVSTNTSSPDVAPNLDAPFIGGTYNIQGTAMNGSAYKGSLTIAEIDTPARIPNLAFDLAWDNGSTGTGILINNVLAASYGGPQCGAVFYGIQEDNGLIGLWTTLDTKAMGTEEFTPQASSSSTLEGEYDVLGTNADGSEYTGTASLIQQGDVWQVIWKIGDSTYDGIGIERNGVLATAYGGEGCGIVAYTVHADGSLDGVWGMWGVSNTGTEFAKK